MSRRRAQYDVEQMAANYLVPGRTAEEQDLMKEIRQAIVHGGPNTKLLLAAIGDEAARNGLRPINAMALALTYGMVLGVLMEKERTRIQVVH